MKLSKYINILRDINCLQTFKLFLRVKKPRSSSLRVINRSNIKLEGTAKIVFDENSSLEIGRSNINLPIKNLTSLYLAENSTLYVHGHVAIMEGSSIILNSGAELHLGTNTYLNGCNVNCSTKITIGSNCAIAGNVKIMDNDWHDIILENEEPKMSKGSIIIGNKVWIGENAIILKNVEIGDGSVIGAGAIVTHSIPAHAHCVAAGVPAKVIKSNVKDWSH